MTESGIIVRQAALADLDLLVPLFDAYREFYRKPSDRDLARRFLEERILHNESIIFLAVDRDGALGFTQLYPSFSSLACARVFILNDLFVRPEARRRKAASLLLAAAAAYARQQGAIRLTLSTEVSNVTAKALYEAEGWKRQQDFYIYDLALEAGNLKV